MSSIKGPIKRVGRAVAPKKYTPIRTGNAYVGLGMRM